MATGSYRIEVRAEFASDEQMGTFIQTQRDYWWQVAKTMEFHGVSHSIELIDADTGQSIEGWAV